MAPLPRRHRALPRVARLYVALEDPHPVPLVASTLTSERYVVRLGTRAVYMGLPVLIGRGCVTIREDLELDDTEIEGLRRSALTLAWRLDRQGK